MRGWRSAIQIDSAIDAKPIIHFPESGRLRDYSITLSALNSSVCGIVRPNALAVLRLITK